MSTPQTFRKPLRLWPGVAVAILIVLLQYVVPAVAPRMGLIGLMVGAGGALIIILWWLLFSRARWYERLAAIGIMVVSVIAVHPWLHPSIAGAGQGYLSYAMSAPAMCVALVGWAMFRDRLSGFTRWAAMAAAIFAAAATLALLRTDGVVGDADINAMHWRWTPTAEERLLAQTKNEPEPMPPAPPAPTPIATEPAAKDKGAPPPAGSTNPTNPANPTNPPPPTNPASPIPLWPGFRGPNRDGVVRAAQVATDWSASPPVKMWSRPIGPGWSSFAVDGDFLYTQEQRGPDELVSCYRVSTGAPVWRHKDPVRFYESNGGAGPRGTPTLAGGRVYSFGATGILNALDAKTGAVIWSRNVSTDSNVKVPFWGFSSSPLVVNDLVIVAAGGKLAAFDIASGKPRWIGPTGAGGYSSPHTVTLDGVQQVVLLSGVGARGFAPADGAVLWQHDWEGGPITQPAVTPDGDLLIVSAVATGGQGVRRLSVRKNGQKWVVEERWTSRGLKPNYNDFVVHKGHAYGFDGTILASIDLTDGTRKWKGGRYGAGQLMLLPDQDLLLVVSEEGELALVSATPDEFKEIARFKAIEGKTWNHPVLIKDVLLVRNGEEMAAFRLPAPAR